MFSTHPNVQVPVHLVMVLCGLEHGDHNHLNSISHSFTAGLSSRQLRLMLYIYVGSNMDQEDVLAYQSGPPIFSSTGNNL